MMTAIQAAAILATLLVSCRGLEVVVTMTTGNKVSVEVEDPRTTTVAQFRAMLREKAVTSEDKTFARVVSLCNPHRVFKLDPTPILPLEENQTLYEQGVYTVFSSSLELPQSFFAFKDGATGETFTLPGCEWSTPDEVLVQGRMPYREYPSEENKKRVPPTSRGKNANAFDTIEGAMNAKDKVSVISDDYCSFTIQFSPTEKPITNIFPCKPNKTTVAELKSAVKKGIKDSASGRELWAASCVLCKDMTGVEGEKKNEWQLKGSDTLKDAFGDTLDIQFQKPATFIRVLVEDAAYDVPVCPAMTVKQVESQIIARLGLKPDTKVTFEQAELAGKLVIPVNQLYIYSFMFLANQSPVYMIRLCAFDKTDFVHTDVSMEPSAVIQAVTKEGSKLFKDRRVLIAVVVLIFGVVLITVGIMSSSSNEEVLVADLTKTDDLLPNVNETLAYKVSEREALPEVNLQEPEYVSAPVVDESVFSEEHLPSPGKQAFESHGANLFTDSTTPDLPLAQSTSTDEVNNDVPN